MKKIAIVGVAALVIALAGCAGSSIHPLASTVTVTVSVPATVTVTASAAPEAGGSASSSVDPSTSVAFRYGPRGAYAVGQAQGGLTQVIPPGRYRIEGVEGQGFLKQCDSVVCDMSNTDGIIDTTLTESGLPTIVEILASATAVYLFDTTATPLE
jgi:hypothetical protein